MGRRRGSMLIRIEMDEDCKYGREMYIRTTNRETEEGCNREKKTDDRQRENRR